jgi:hypothetical protein
MLPSLLSMASPVEPRVRLKIATVCKSCMQQV